MTRAGYAAGIAFLGVVFFCTACVKEKSPPPFTEVTPSGAPTAAPNPSPIARPTVSPSRPPDATVPPGPRKNPFVKPTLPPPRGEREQAIRLSPSPSPASSPGQAHNLANEAGLMAYYPQQRLMPEDFTIGPLQDGVSATRNYLRALATIRGFLDSLGKKKVDYELVVPAVKDEIKSVVSYPLSQGYVPERYRIGKIAFESDDELRADIRMYKGDGVTTGEIYLKKIEDKWLVSDLQAGFTLLAKKYEKPKQPFVPGSYRFLLKNH